MAMGNYSVLKKTFFVGILLLVGVVVLIPQHAEAVTVPDPEGRGWICDQTETTRSILGITIVKDVTRCTNPENEAIVWTKECPQDPSNTSGCTICSEHDGNPSTPQICDTEGVGTEVVLDEDGTPTGDRVHQENFISKLFKDGLLALVLSPIAVVSFLILTISSFLLYLAGILFNWAVAFLVFNFATTLGNSSGMLLAWGILRDFGNIILLFGFVYMGIQTILNLHHYNVGKTLSRLVIFAILLNFSLFISEAIIDTSNVLASTLYNQTSFCGIEDMECLINSGVASHILQRAGIASALGFGGQNQEAVAGLQAGVGDGGKGNYLTNPIGETLKFLGLAILVTTAAVVLFAGAFLLISRAIFLAFLMVVSPIGFAGMAVPWLEKIAKDWWDALIKQSLFAPVFLLLLFVGLKVLEGLDTLRGGGLGSAITAKGGLDTGPILLFMLVIGFMIAALLAAKKFGIYGAEAVTKTGTGIIGHAAGAATFGAMGWAARRTIGSASQAAASRLRSRTSVLGRIPVLGQRLTGIADMGAKASFDGRSSLKGVDLGSVSKVSKEGRRGELEATKKLYEEHKKSLDEEDKKNYEMAKSEKERLGDKILEQGVAWSAGNRKAGPSEGAVKKYNAAVGKMAQTTEGKRKQEEDKKEEFDKSVDKLKEVGVRLDQISERLKSLNSELARTDISADRRASLLGQRTALEDEETERKAEFDSERPKYEGLRQEVERLRRTISREESQYRRNVQGATVPNIAGLSPVDRRVLREAVVGMRKGETSFKPKKLDDALSRALKKRLNIA